MFSELGFMFLKICFDTKNQHWLTLTNFGPQSKINNPYFHILVAHTGTMIHHIVRVLEL